MDLSVTSAWNLINNMSAEMMKCARCEEWDELSLLQKNRDQLIRQYFSNTLEKIIDNNPTVLAQNIQSILDMDKLILEICQTQKDSASTALAGFQASRKANNAYLDNSA